MTSTLKRKLARVRLLLCDVDGVLTDGTVWMGEGGEAKRFHIRDGLGLRILMRQGVQVGWISRRPSEATRLRAEDLNLLERVGVAVVVRDGAAEPRRLADYVTRRPGGQGAIREVAELILKAQGKWRQVLDEYTS